MSQQNMLGSALAEIAGPLKDFFEKIGGEDREVWFTGFKRFLRKENPWSEPTGTFIRDMRKEGWTLLENPTRRLTSVSSFELVPFLRDGEDPIGGEEMLRCARVELDANYGQEDADFLLKHQVGIPQEFRSYYLVFPATVWRDSYGNRCVPVLGWYGKRWYLSFSWLEYGWYSSDRLVRPRK